MGFPVDDLTLAAVEHALQASYVVDADGRLELADGFDFDIRHLLMLYSEGTRFSMEDVCLSLIDEIRRLRGLLGPERVDTPLDP